MIKMVINNQKSVMRFCSPFENLHRLHPCLTVVLITQTCHTCSYALSINYALHSRLSYIKHIKCLGIYIVINNDNTLFGSLYKIFYGHTSREKLSIEKYHLCRRRTCTDEKIKLLLLLGLRIFNTKHTLRLLVKACVYLTLHSQ